MKAGLGQMIFPCIYKNLLVWFNLVTCYMLRIMFHVSSLQTVNAAPLIVQCAWWIQLRMFKVY